MEIPFDPEEITRTVTLEFEKDIRETVFRALTNVVLGTPVGNPLLWQFPNSAPPGYVGGHARRNWLVGINRFPVNEVAGVDPGGGTAIASGRTVVATAKANQVVWLVNNTPYIARLNNGHSTQAPIGFVETAIDIAVNGRDDTKEI